MRKFREFDTVGLLLLEEGLDYHEPDLVAEICDRAGLSSEYANSASDSLSDSESFESVLDRAIDILKRGF